MNKILDVVEDIKQNITDKQYKTVMESLMEIIIQINYHYQTIIRNLIKLFIYSTG